MMDKYRQIWLFLMPEARLSKECGFFRLKILGLDIGISWPSEYGDFSLDIALFGYGIAFSPWRVWWTFETYTDFWRAIDN